MASMKKVGVRPLLLSLSSEQEVSTKPFFDSGTTNGRERFTLRTCFDAITFVLQSVYKLKRKRDSQMLFSS